IAVVRSVAGSVAHGVQADPYVASAEQRLRRPLARPLALLRRWLDPSSPTGLFLTTAVALAAVLVAAFANVTSQVPHHGALTEVDVRLANLSDLLHHGEPVRAATFFSLIGGAPIRIPLSVAVFGVV